MDTPVVVQVALSGFRDPSEGAAIPISDEEVVADALAAWDAGAAVIHLHAREPDGTPSARAERFAPLIEGIRVEGCDAILSLACEPPDTDVKGPDCYDGLRLRPELASFELGIGDPSDPESDEPSRIARQLAGAFRDVGTAPEIQCSHPGHVRTALRLRDEGLLSDPLRFQIVARQPGHVPPTIEDVLGMRATMPDDAIWSVSATGGAQIRLNVLCLLAGGHVRTGLEDNAWLAEDLPATNEGLVQRVVRIIDELDRPLATPDEARAILRLGGVDGHAAVARRNGSTTGGSQAVDFELASG